MAKKKKKKAVAAKKAAAKKAKPAKAKKAKRKKKATLDDVVLMLRSLEYSVLRAIDRLDPRNASAEAADAFDAVATDD